MIIYIASSWRNFHAVEMLTDLLKNKGHRVNCFVRDAGEKVIPKDMKFEDWIYSPKGTEAFTFDTQSAMNCDLLIYMSPSGCDAWAEVGAAYSKKVPIIGLWNSKEKVGIMRRMVGTWFTDYIELLKLIDNIEKDLK